MKEGCTAGTGRDREGHRGSGTLRRGISEEERAQEKSQKERLEGGIRAEFKKQWGGSAAAPQGTIIVH